MKCGVQVFSQLYGFKSLAIFPKLLAFFLEFKLKNKIIQIFPISFCLATGEILPQKNHWQGKVIHLGLTRVRAYMR